MQKTKIVLASLAGCAVFISITVAKAAPIWQKIPKYTVNYATKTTDQPASVDTVIAVTNQTPLKYNGRYILPKTVEIDFLDPSGTPVCVAMGKIPSKATLKFATSDSVLPFHYIDFPAYEVVDPTTLPPTTGQTLCSDFQGRAEIKSNTGRLQVAPWFTVNGMPTSIPVQKGRQATKGFH